MNAVQTPSRRLALLLGLLSACIGAPAQERSITGTWQGTLPGDSSQRIVLKITSSNDHSLHATRYQIDKSPEGLPFSSVAFHAPEIDLDQIYAGFSFHGRLAPDGKSISGNWTQGKQSWPITFLLATPETLWSAPTPALAPMSATADPAFEVATIKPSPPDAKGYSYSVRTRTFAARNRTLQELMQFAYNLRDRQIQGGPDWVTRTKFDISAEPNLPGQPDLDQDRLMLRKLLAERFHLTTHRIQQVVPVYALTRNKAAPPLSTSDPEFNRGSIYTKEQPDGQTLVHFLGHTMPMFADILMNFIKDRQIVDETGLSGHFEFDLQIPSATLASPDDEEKANAFIRAVQPLGFKLVPKRAPIDIIVIDHVEPPSPN